VTSPSLSLVPFRDTPYSLQFAFAGVMFSVSSAVLLGSGIYNHCFVTQGKSVHIIARSYQTNSTNLTVDWIENGVDIAGSSGPSQFLYNVNRVLSDTTNTASLFSSPTTSASSGVSIETIGLVPADKWVQTAPEFILENNKMYLIQANNHNSTGYFVINLTWYESGN
jgi:hypothetical protein